MGAHHTTNFGTHLQATARGKHYVTVLEPTDRTWQWRKFELRDRSTTKLLAHMTAQPLPGCCGVIVFYRFGGKKLKDVARLIAYGYEAARGAGYGQAILTLRDGSKLLEVPEITGETMLQWRNGKTDNMVVTVIRALLQEPHVGAVGNVEGE